MCGITGILERKTTLTRDRLVRFTDALAHRGPDGSGYYLDAEAQLGLGHRRLSILDPTPAGQQPMGYADGRYQLAFNGEVYNFLELRDELESLGHAFYNDTDTEVLLAAYAEWGASAFGRMNGMWALALWDARERELLLCRDRYGIKPLYYIDTPKRFAFASETIAFKHLEGYERRIDAAHLADNLEDNFALEGRNATIFEGIVQVPAGHILRLRPSGSPQLSQWWHAEAYRPEMPTDYAEQVAQYRDLLEQAVRLRLRADVPLGTALSGGLDSSSVYAMVHYLMQSPGQVTRSPQQWQQAFTLTFPGSPRDERAQAEEVVQHVGGEHRLILPDEVTPEQVLERTRRFDSVYSHPNFILANLYTTMRRHGVKVSLDGHGVDELLFGYPNMLHDLRQNLAAVDPIFARRIADMLPDVKLRVSSAAPTLRRRVRRQLGTFYRKLRHTGYTHKTVAEQHYRPIQRQYFTETMLPAILRNFDRASMQSGVEVRMPFMDHRLVEYVRSLPLESMLMPPYTKRILRDAIRPLLPAATVDRKLKIGIVTPINELFERQLRELVLDTVHEQDFISSPHWDGVALRDMALQQGDTWSVAESFTLWKYLNAYWVTQ